MAKPKTAGGAASSPWVQTSPGAYPTLPRREPSLPLPRLAHDGGGAVVVGLFEVATPRVAVIVRSNAVIVGSNAVSRRDRWKRIYFSTIERRIRRNAVLVLGRRDVLRPDHPSPPGGVQRHDLVQPFREQPGDLGEAKTAGCAAPPPPRRRGCRLASSSLSGATPSRAAIGGSGSISRQSNGAYDEWGPRPRTAMRRWPTSTGLRAQATTSAFPARRRRPTPSRCCFRYASWMATYGHVI